MIKKIFVCEFITGGGLCAEPLPKNLAKEGALMRDALLCDLAELPYEVCTTVDVRLRAPEHCECVAVRADDDIWHIWQTQFKAADVVFLIAPETDGVLHYLTQMAALKGALVLGCGLTSIAITSDKMATFLALKAAGIVTIDTFNVAHWSKHEVLKRNMTWLAKPNDGAGCEAIVRFDDAENLMHWLAQNNKQSAHIIQPFIAGEAASISCIMQNGVAHLLSCNRQIIEYENHTLSLKGVVVNGMRAQWQAFEMVANKIAKALSDLAGYVGIDVIVDGDEIIVVEINPRLTTSYAGLRAATGQNVTELLINSFVNTNFKMPTLQREQVTIHV
jgi:tyramine---L-glutamate ligase